MVLRALRLKKLANHICEVIAGRHVHPIAIVPGGFTKYPSLKELKALKEVPGKWRLMVRLIGEDGKVVKGDHVPIGGLYPPGLWRPGEDVVDKHKIHIDMYKTKVGDYRIWMGFRNGSRPVEVRDSTIVVRLDEVRARAFRGTINE